MGEKNFETQLKKDFYKKYPEGIWRKTHGNQYSSGQPDILVSCVHGAAAVELKWAKNARHVIAESVDKLVTPLQKVTLKKYEKSCGPIRPRVIVGVDTPDGILAVSVMLSHIEDIRKMTYERIYEECIEKDTRTFKLWTVTAQLRKPRVDSWDTPFLLNLRLPDRSKND